MTVTDELLRNNAEFASSFSNGDLPMPPGKHLAVVACMDARLNPYGLLGLSEGDAHVIRNAGGVVTDDVGLEVNNHMSSLDPDAVIVTGTPGGLMLLHKAAARAGTNESFASMRLLREMEKPARRPESNPLVP